MLSPTVIRLDVKNLLRQDLGFGRVSDEWNARFPEPCALLAG